VYVYLIALNTTGSELLFVAGGAVDLLLSWDEAFGPDGGLANAAAEAFLVPLPRLVLHLLSSCNNNNTQTLKRKKTFFMLKSLSYFTSISIFPRYFHPAPWLCHLIKSATTYLQLVIMQV